MKALPSPDLTSSLLPGPLVFHKLKSLLGDEDLKSFDLLAFIKIDSCLMLQFLNFKGFLDPKLKKPCFSLEAAAAALKKAEIIQFIQLELLKAETFSYSREFFTHYAQLWEAALFTAAFLEAAAPLLNVEESFAYTLGLLGSIDRIVECFLDYGPMKTSKAAYIQGNDKHSLILARLPIPEAILPILMAQKEPELIQEPLAYALNLAGKLQKGQKVEALPASLGFTLETLPSLYKKTEKRLQGIHRFISVF